MSSILLHVALAVNYFILAYAAAIPSTFGLRIHSADKRFDNEILTLIKPVPQIAVTAPAGTTKLVEPVGPNYNYLGTFSKATFNDEIRNFWAWSFHLEKSGIPPRRSDFLKCSGSMSAGKGSSTGGRTFYFALPQVADGPQVVYMASSTTEPVDSQNGKVSMEKTPVTFGSPARRLLVAGNTNGGFALCGFSSTAYRLVWNKTGWQSTNDNRNIVRRENKGASGAVTNPAGSAGQDCTPVKIIKEDID